MTEPNDGDQSGAGIAATVGELMARATEAAQPANSADAAEIRAITEAMMRLLIGVPLRCDGQLTVKSLAVEAGLMRNKLTHKYTGLKDLFYALVNAQQSRPRIVDDLERDNRKLRERVEKLRAERDELKQAVEGFARVVHILEVENHQLRSTANKDGTLRVLTPRARSGEHDTIGSCS